eukprot:TRINITY_DN775_c0_g1_i3.p1 TRINITY_DN775_c0_g1~~TRINITY_DN775_c0_g1_i3.p1  ORF type:complete len:134 (+),score=45.43 TRINITY_DN775_c0_g1_i3:92-493(+)
MPRYYCDYCDVYLTHDSFSGRRQHMEGRRHQENVRQHYSEILLQQQQQTMQMNMNYMGQQPSQFPGYNPALFRVPPPMMSGPGGPYPGGPFPPGSGPFPTPPLNPAINPALNPAINPAINPALNPNLRPSAST